jgi:stringent starvation protein B
MHEWISDSSCTPHIVVDAALAGVEVPGQYVRDGKIILNVSWTATSQLRLGNDEVSFQGRFGGASMNVRVPLAAVLAIYARETGQGMIFTDEDGSPAPVAAGEQSGAPKPPPGGKRARLKVVK